MTELFAVERRHKELGPAYLRPLIGVVAAMMWSVVWMMHVQTAHAEQGFRDVRADFILHRLLGDDMQLWLGSVPAVEVIRAPRPGAVADFPSTVRLTSGLLDSVRSDDELAFAIAHELGHLSLHHSSTPALMGNRTRTMIDEELAADRIAMRLLEGARFSPTAGITLLTRLDVRDHRGRSLYPSLGLRRTALSEHMRRPHSRLSH